MIKIIVQQTITEAYEETKNFVVKRTPTEIVQVTSYGSSEDKVQFVEEMEPRQVMQTRQRTLTLLEQEILNDSNFDLKAVIRAVNKIE